MKAKNIEQSIWNNMKNESINAELLAACKLFADSGWLVELPEKAQNTIQAAIARAEANLNGTINQ